MSLEINDNQNLVTTLEDDDVLLAMRGAGVKRIRKSSLAAQLRLASSFGLNVKEFGSGMGDGVGDDTAAFQAAVLELIAHGGGTLYVPTGTYDVDYLDLFDASITSGVAQRTIPPIRIIGEGMMSRGEPIGVGDFVKGGSILRMHSTRANGCIYARNTGYAELSGLTFWTVAGRGPSTSPHVKVMNTTTHIHRCGFISENDGIGVQYGGGLQAVSGSGAINDNHGFQGYGSTLKECFFYGQIVGVWGRCYANAISITENNAWQPIGPNPSGPLYAAGLDSFIIFDGKDEVTPTKTDIASGGYIAGNLIEMTYYKYGVKFLRARNFACVGNNFYDHGSQALACYYLGPHSHKNYIMPGWSLESIIPLYINDAGSAGENRIIEGVIIP